MYFIDFAAGDLQEYEQRVTAYHKLEAWLREKGSSYGLSDQMTTLDDVAKETVASIYESEAGIELTADSWTPPQSLRLPRLFLDVDSSTGLQKTRSNFHSLITDEQSLMAKTKGKGGIALPLKYQGSTVFRVEKDFVAQMGDVTRQDGSGGESIYGGTFKDESEGLKIPAEYGTLAMANSGRNSNTSQVVHFIIDDAVDVGKLIHLSQFFVTLAQSPATLKKLTGKYVIFGKSILSDDDQGRSSRACLERLNGLGDGKGGTSVKVWIDDCGLL